jgi:hypothetical protein
MKYYLCFQDIRFLGRVVSRSCADSRSGTLSRRSRVVVQQSPETLTATNATNTTLRRRTLNQFIAQSLMIPFTMIMGDKLGDCPSKRGCSPI